MSSIKPIIGISTNEITNFGGRQVSHSTGLRYVNAVAKFTNGIPILIPSYINNDDLDQLLKKLDGIVLTGGRANIEPHHFGGKPFPPDEPIDVGRDEIVLKLIPKCVSLGIPIFGICRGIQEMNVAYGGTLHYRVHQLPEKNDHRMPREDDVTIKEIFKLRHRIDFTKNGYFYNLINKENCMVNSLHGQAINALAQNLKIEALSDDGVIEAISIPEHPSFAVGVQWHAEYEPENNDLNRCLFKEFGLACSEYVKKNK
jgi:putative glutamine amidotransferase